MAASRKSRASADADEVESEATPRRRTRAKAKPRSKPRSKARAEPKAREPRAKSPSKAKIAKPRAAQSKSPAEAEEKATRPPRRRKRPAGRKPAPPPETTGGDPSGIPPLPDEADDLAVFEPQAGREPAREAPADASPAEILDGVKRGVLHVSALGGLSDASIRDLAGTQGLAVARGESRSDILYRLLQAPSAETERETQFTEGLLELHPDGYGFLRLPERNFVQHPSDVYVSAGLIRKLGLKPGHWISGTAKPSRPGERMLALQAVEEVNHQEPDRLGDQTTFDELTVVYPDERFILEVNTDDIEMRVMDLFCPLGRGQRAIITAPPRTGKTVLLQKLADSIAHNSPGTDIVVLLVDERPEEVTNMRRSVRGDVIASTFDRPAANHVRVAELVMEKVKRMVEFGRHVVLLLDSITRLGRAYNNLSGPSGRILTGGLDAKALTKPKRFFGAARNVEDGGSLTIIATALIDTGSRLDDVIFEEFKGTGNMEVVLDRGMANNRIWPAIHIPASGTRNEDLLLHPEELRRITLIRKGLTGQDPLSSMVAVREMMEQYKTNAELLMSIG